MLTNTVSCKFGSMPYDRRKAIRKAVSVRPSAGEVRPQDTKSAVSSSFEAANTASRVTVAFFAEVDADAVSAGEAVRDLVLVLIAA